MNRKKITSKRVRGFLLCFHLLTASNPFHFLIYLGITFFFCFNLLVFTEAFLFFKGSHKTEELRHWTKVFFFLFCYKPVTIFLDFVWGGGRSWKRRRLMLP